MPESIACPRSGRADIRMAVVAVNSPRMQHALVVNELVSGTAHVVHDLVFTAFLKRIANATAQIIQDFVPTHALPLPFTTLPCPAQWIEDALRIVDLIDGGRPFGAVASAAAGMRRIAFKLLHLHLLFIYISQQAAGSFTVEADGRDQRIVFLNSSGPLRGIVFSPVLPAAGWRKTGKFLRLQLLRCRIEGKLRLDCHNCEN